MALLSNISIFLFESSNVWRYSYLNSFNLQLIFALSVYLGLEAHL